MKKILAKLWDWLTDTFFSRYVVTREDYNYVHALLWTSENHARQLAKHLMKVMDEAYKPYATIADYATEKLEFVSHVQHEIPAFRWAIQIPQARFMTMRGFPEKEMLKRYFAEKITQAFGEHIKRNLFKLDEQGSEMNARTEVNGHKLIQRSLTTNKK